jgi:hypothetical protein
MDEKMNGCLEPNTISFRLMLKEKKDLERRKKAATMARPALLGLTDLRNVGGSDAPELGVESKAKQLKRNSTVKSPVAGGCWVLGAGCWVLDAASLS